MKKKIALYFVLRFLVIAAMVLEFLKGDYYGVFLCVLTLILFMIPTFLDKKMNIKLPSLLEIIILLFIFSAEILGEIQGFYLKFPYWDTILHTLNGFIMAGIGLAMIDILNRTPSFHFNMSPIFVVLVSFCFSMTVGILWEFFEFGMDYFTLTDMQKDTVLTQISTVEPSLGEGQHIIKDIDKTVIHAKKDGEDYEVSVSGYLDIGLYDTMSDLFVNCIGALTFSLFGIFYLKGRSKFALKFIPQIKSQEENI